MGRGGTSSQCMCNKENRDSAVTNCRKRGREEEEMRRKRSVRDAQKSLQLLVRTRCDLRDKPIRRRTREREDEKHNRGTGDSERKGVQWKNYSFQREETE